DHEPGYIVARHIFHDLASKAQMRSQPTHHAHTEDKITHGTCPGPARPGKACCHHSADGSLPATVRRLKRKHLSAPFQRSVEVSQPGACTCRDDEFSGVVRDYARMAGDIHYRQTFRHGPAQKCLGASAHYAESFTTADRFPHTFQKHLALILTSVSIEPLQTAHQNRSSSGNGSCPLCTCMAPNSAQRCSVGMFLPGLSSPSSSKAALIS